MTCCVAFCCILLRLADADLLDHRHRYYVASDNVKHRAFVGMTPSDIIGLFEGHPLEFDGRRATGTVRISKLAVRCTVVIVLTHSLACVC